jgi:hypothetical protein
MPTTVDQVLLAPGFRMPFYPMRPRHGVAIRDIATLERILDEGSGEYDFTLKLNGDRGCVGVLDGDVHVQNRHGSWYKMTVDNLGVFAKLNGSWLFDGEVYKKQFIPFEVLVAGGQSMAGECPTFRRQAARMTCDRLSIPWPYGGAVESLVEVVRECIASGSKHIEGVVGKKIGSRYVPLGSEAQESPTWLKHRWC